MNLVDNPYALKSGEAQLATDVDISVRDVLGSRKGFSGAGLSQTLSSQTKSAGKVISNPILGSVGWTNPENAKTLNFSYANANFVTPGSRIGTSSQPLWATNFGFVLPAGATPVAVKVEMRRKKTNVGGPWGPSHVSEMGMKLIRGGVEVGSGRFYNPSGSSTWNSEVAELATYGSSEDIWGTTLTKAQVESLEGFGCRLMVGLDSSDGHEIRAEVDSISMTVYYLTEGVSSAADHVRPWYVGAIRNLMMSMNGTIRRLKGGETTVTELFAGTAGTTWSFEQMEYNPGTGFKDSLWMMNGTDAAKKWDGTTFADWAGKPPKGNMLRVWKNRMIVSGVAKFPQRVFFSEIADPEKPEDETNGGYGNNWIDIRTSEDDLDPVTWLEVIDDVLIVFKKRSVNAIFDPTTFSFTRIANVGCEGRFQSCVLDDRCYFVNRTGVYSVTAQGSPRYESLNIEPMFKGTGPAGLTAIDLNLLGSSARMCALPNGVIHLACTPKGSQANRWVLKAYPRLRGAVGDREDPRTPWVKDSFAKRCVKSMCAYRANDAEVDKVVAGLTNEAGASPELVYLYEGIRDGLEPITWQWRSGFKSLISEEPLERIRRLNLVMKGKLVAKMIKEDGTVAPDGTATLESEKEALKYYRPESRSRYHALDLSESGQTPTQVFKGEFVLRGGKEDK